LLQARDGRKHILGTGNCASYPPPNSFKFGWLIVGCYLAKIL
jgi:hypothetical protein